MSVHRTTSLCTEDDGNPGMTAPACENGECTWEAAQTGLPCDDGSVCSTESTCGLSGVCEATAIKECDDGNACTNDGCDALTGCFHDPLSRAPAKTEMDVRWATSAAMVFAYREAHFHVMTGRAALRMVASPGRVFSNLWRGFATMETHVPGEIPVLTGSVLEFPERCFAPDDNPCTEDFW